MVGFHANDAKRCESFAKGGPLIIDHDDLIYLGTGMYFWDCLSQAKFWLEEKKKERIVSAVINTDDVDSILNINDVEYRQRLSMMFDRVDRVVSKDIQQKMTQYHLTLDECTGVKLDILFKKYKMFSDKINVIKGIYTKKVERNEFFHGTVFEKNFIEILCVRNERPVSDRKIVNGK